MGSIVRGVEDPNQTKVARKVLEHHKSKVKVRKKIDHGLVGRCRGFQKERRKMVGGPRANVLNDTRKMGCRN